jgi:hypothetical protein
MSDIQLVHWLISSLVHWWLAVNVVVFYLTIGFIYITNPSDLSVRFQVPVPVNVMDK